jgi:TolB-like protein/DNA-binding winged helix-turn-helix (wHTH) protein/Tfp pilus assembly protein PilF
VATSAQPSNRLCFDGFEVDLSSGEVWKHGIRVRLQVQPFRVLHVLLERRGEIVTRDELKQTLWPADTFVDFDDGLNTAVKKIRDLLGDSADRPRYIETIPRRGYRFVAPVKMLQGVDPVAVLERHTQEQVIVEPVTNVAEAVVSVPRSIRRYRWVAGIAVILLAGACAFAWRTDRSNLRTRIRGKVSPPRIQSIAVLPLDNLSRDPSQEYFSDGITDALITSLAQIHSLHVISRTSAMRYKKTSKSLPEIARELGVDAVFEGSVQRDANRVRIAGQLIQADTDTSLWGKSYEFDLSDALKIESEVSRAIATEIRNNITPEEYERLSRVRTIAPAAQDLFLQARNSEENRDDVSLGHAIQQYEKALALQPDFAEAYAGISRAWLERGVWGAIEFRDAEVPARSAALKALQLDPGLGDAHAALAQLFAFYDFSWVTAEQEFRRAIELEPNSTYAHRSYGVVLEALSRFPEAIAEEQRALTFDPLSSLTESEYARVLFRARRFEEAVRHFQRAIELDPQNFGAHTRLAEVYEQTGEFHEALALIQETIRNNNPAPMKLGRAYALLGRRSDALNILRDVTRRVPNPKSTYEISVVYFALGDRDRGFEWLTKAFDQRQMVIYTGVDPRFDNVRNDPRFNALVHRLGTPDNH